ncbi:MAG TPA: solute carrier family 23 protein [Bauldia sp.]|nr:solute carrier family 23 protein [Bauldia sp.]
MATKPSDLVYGVEDVPPFPRLAALGLQYAILISVYLILVVLVARAAKASPDVTTGLVSLALIAAALGTSVQAWNGRFFGSGFLAPPVYSAIYFGPAILAAKSGGLPAVAGMTVFAALVEIGFSQLLDRLRVVFQPVIAGFAVLVVGLQLGIVGTAETLDVSDETLPGFPSHVLVGAVTLAACVAFSIWGRGVFRLVSTLLGIIIGVALGFATGLIGTPIFAAIGAAAWLDLPDPSFIAYGFEPALIPAFVASATAATLRTVGVVTTAQRINDADWKRPDMENIARGIAGDGIGCLAGGLVGAPGMSSAASLVGLSSATAATSRAIAYATAVILLVFAFVPKIGAAIIAMPLEIAGAILVFTATFLVVSGIQVMIVRGLDLRSGFAVSIALFVGLLTQVKPEYFDRLPDWLQTVTSDMLTVCLAIAIGLTLVFRIGIRRRGAATWDATDAARGEFTAFLGREGTAWKLGEDVIERARDAVGDLIDHLKEGAYLLAPVAIKASYDNLELTVVLVYRGRPPPVFHHTRASHAILHEEAAAAGGLAGFFLGAGADRTTVTTRDDEVTIKLDFAA